MQQRSHKTRQNALAAFYTDAFIAQVLTERTVLHKLRRYLSVDTDFSPETGNLVQILPLLPKSSVNKILHWHCLDPAVGSGIFLLKLAQIFDQIYQTFHEYPSSIRERRQHIVMTHLFGWDIDPIAIQLTLHRLFLWTLGQSLHNTQTNLDLEEKYYSSPQKTVPFTLSPKEVEFQKNMLSQIRTQNALEVGLQSIHPQFDLILSNPPFGNIALNQIPTAVLKQFSCRPSEIAELFLEMALKLLDPYTEGILGFIFPKTSAYYQKWERCRQLILQERIVEIADLGLAFPNVNFEVIALMVQKKLTYHNATENQKSEIGAGEGVIQSEFLPKNTFPKSSWHVTGTLPREFFHDESLIYSPLSPKTRRILHYMTNTCFFLGNLKEERQQTVFSDRFRRSLYIADEQKDLFLPGDQLYLNKVPDMDAFCLKRLYCVTFNQEINEYLHPKLLFKVLRGSRLACGIDMLGNILTTEKIMNFFPPEPYITYLHGLMTLLNARPASFFIQALIFNQTTETARVLDPYYAKRIPLPKLSLDQWAFFDKVGRLIHLAAYHTNSLLFDQLEEINENLALLAYYHAISDDLNKPSQIQSIFENMNDTFSPLFSATHLSNYAESYQKILQKVKHNLPLNSSHVLPMHYQIQIWDPQVEVEILANIEDILKILQLTNIPYTWIHETLRENLGK